ncbi:MAG: metalloregulator ArsR/SmtB family transcription factor [Clostridia bacterium]|nr:metalloregulator ArsR/SmtB family transcription factor [Clostridia bacterium]
MENIVKDMAEVFKALGDPTRLQLVWLLNLGGGDNLCVVDLAEKLGVSQPAVSQHIKILKSIKLVEPERKGYRVYYRINTEMLNAIKTNIDSLFKMAFEPCSDSDPCD